MCWKGATVFNITSSHFVHMQRGQCYLRSESHVSIFLLAIYNLNGFTGSRSRCLAIRSHRTWRRKRNRVTIVVTCICTCTTPFVVRRHRFPHLTKYVRKSECRYTTQTNLCRSMFIRARQFLTIASILYKWKLQYQSEPKVTSNKYCVNCIEVCMYFNTYRIRSN